MDGLHPFSFCPFCRLNFSARITCSTQQHATRTTIRTWVSIQAVTIPLQSKYFQIFSERSAFTVARNIRAFGLVTIAPRPTSDGCARRSTGGANKTTRMLAVGSVRQTLHAPTAKPFLTVLCARAPTCVTRLCGNALFTWPSGAHRSLISASTTLQIATTWSERLRLLRGSGSGSAGHT